MNTKECPACKEVHATGAECWWAAHRGRHPECKCQWCHALVRPMSPTTVDVSTISEYGLTQKLSNSIRVY